MVLPDGARDGAGRPRPRRTTLAVLAMAALLVGAALFAALTPPDSELAGGDASTTTTGTTPIDRPVDLEDFSIDQIAMGEPLRLTRIASFQDTSPRFLVGHDDWFYVFGWSEPREQGSAWAAPVLGWRSRDGVEWEELGNPFGEDTEIASVSAAGERLVALEATAVAGSWQVWLSEDGVDWTRLLVPTGSGDPYQTVFPGAVFGDDDSLLLTGSVAFDGRRFLGDHLEGAGVPPDLVRERGWSSDVIDGEPQVTVYGPFGMPVFMATYDELGLSEEDEERLSAAPTKSGVEVWVSGDGGDWLGTSIPDADWLTSIVAVNGDTTGSRGLLALGYGNDGPTAWRSRDRLTWVEEETSIPGLSEAASWNGLILATGERHSEIFLSADQGRDWDPVGLDRHFPDELDWSLGGLRAGEAGIAAVVDGWDRGSMQQPRGTNHPTLQQGDTTLSLDFEAGVFELDTPEGTFTWRLFQNLELEEGLEVDLEEETVGFRHPETGEELAAFGFDDLERVERDYWLGTAFAEEGFQALVFSPDGERWSIQDPSQSLGDGRQIANLEVFGDRLLVAVVDQTALYADGSAPGFEIWSAALP